MLAATSTSLVDMASQLSEAEERERTFNGRGRWNHVRNLSEAKSIMNYLLNLASSSRCSLRDKEVSCREKDAEIKYLKEKVVILGGLTRQLATEKADLALEVKTKRNPRAFMDDMDTSQSEYSDMNASDEDDWMQSKKERARRKAFLATRANDMKINKGYVDGLLCCSCNEKSLCETSKCQCRANGSCCGQSIDCSSVKCCNKEIKANISSDLGTDEENNLVAHGAMLLQNALGSEKEDETDEDGHTGRKALSDIGNIMRENRAAPLNTKNGDPPKQQDGRPTTDSDKASKLSRARRAAASSTSNKLLPVRSTDKEPIALAPTTSEEKENLPSLNNDC
ncbi:hypothetical protein F3Y22_tig00110511pilonHSYRG00175 [Hibiscus syriacus]|uniref:Tesmin/TSO1-like CXC domain-containing protein n=1 Tax=Hibiscus syriacus TaxID=106335 RepID=A0A6A3AFY9_HIBSY|nr:hypothetical protein F3Y22_tig00110511pilonHSYRG00175 [Hibiscus syriacus]